MRRSTAAATILALACACTTGAAPAPAKFGHGGGGGVTAPGSPYRYTALSPRLPEGSSGVRQQGGRLTVVVQTTDGEGRVTRWWPLRGAYQLPALTYDGTGEGISADGGTLVLSRFSWIYPPRTTGLAILDTQLDRRRSRHAIRRVHLPSGFTFQAISPDGSTVYLSEHLSRFVGGSTRIRALDASEGELLPALAVGPDERERRTRGVPMARTASRDGRWAYTLYSGYRSRPGRMPTARRASVQVLDTVAARVTRVALPQLTGEVNPFTLGLRLEDGGRDLAVLNPASLPGPRAVLRVDTRAMRVGGPPAAEESDGPPWLPIGVALLALPLGVVLVRRI